MAVEAPAAPQTSGLATVLNVLVAPRDAFARLREVPMWGWAFLLATVLGVIGSLLAAPATAHAVQTGMAAQMAHDPQFAQMTPEKQQQVIRFAAMGVKFGWLFVPVYLLIVALIQAVIMFIANAAARGTGSFKQFWAAAMNISIVTFGIAYLFTGVTTMLRGPQSYTNTAALAASVPSAAWLVPHAGIKTMAFLSGMNPFSIWGVFLVAAALIVIARVSKGAGYATGTVLLLLSGAIAAIFAK